MAETFADKVPTSELTPADSNGSLFMHKRGLEVTINDTTDWASPIINSRYAFASDVGEQKALCESFDNSSGSTFENT